jgi:hypothetical protein
MQELDFGEFRRFVTSSSYPVIDDMVEKEFELKPSALRSILDSWRAEGIIGEGSKIYESKVSYHHAYSRSKAELERGLRVLESEIETYAKLVPILPSHYLVDCFRSHFIKSKNTNLHHRLVEAVINGLVETGNLEKIRRLNQKGGLSHSTYHPEHGSFVRKVIDWGVQQISFGEGFTMSDLAKRDANPKKRFVTGALHYKYDFWVYSITGYLEYLGLGIKQDDSFVPLGDLQ